MSTEMAKWIGVVVFAIGAIFWAGSTYNRISTIEQRLTEIKLAIPDSGRVIRLELDVEDLKNWKARMEQRLDRR